MHRKSRNNLPNKPSVYKFSTRQCSYKHYRCALPCIDGFYYCVRHILEDTHAPFKHCSYVYPNSMKKCPIPAARLESAESFCPEHLCKLQRMRNRAGKAQPPLTSERLLTSLAHYVPSNTPKRKRFDSENEEVDVCDDTKSVDPFADCDASGVNSMLSNVLDYCSESDSDVDAAVIARTARCNDEDSSDAESADSAGEDVFKFSSVFTEEEALIRAKEKTTRLKALYSDQLNRLSHLLRERRRDYLKNIQKEKEANCSIQEQPRNSVRELVLAEKVKSYNNYRKHLGAAAIMRKRMLEKRAAASSDAAPHRGPWGKCNFTEGGVKCSVRSLPSSKFCPKHILEDGSQVLFRSCGFGNGDVCKEPLPGIEPCVYHMDIPPQQINYNTTFSEDDDDEKIGAELKTEDSSLYEIPEDAVNEDSTKFESVEEELVQNTSMDFIEVLNDDQVVYNQQLNVEGTFMPQAANESNFMHPTVDEGVAYSEEVVTTEE